MKKLVMGLFGAVLLASSVAATAADIAGNVTMASDYRFRGISQLDANISPAIQGGFDFSFEPGFYVGTWASNVNLGTGASVELDWYGGYASSLNESIDYDVGVLYYSYPKDGGQDLDYVEIYGKLDWEGFTFGLNYSNDYYAESGKFAYPYVDYGFDYDRWSFAGHVGYNAFDKDDFLGNDDKYVDYSVSVSTTEWGVDWTLALVGTDLSDDDDCFGDEDFCQLTAVLSMSKSL